MTQNPEEGRISEERAAELLQQSRKRTVEMRREYRNMRREKEATDKAKAWADRHKQKHEDAYDDIERASQGGNPLNRRGRRNAAKLMNVFKTPQGWQHFNNNYGRSFGKREPYVKRNAPKPVQSNITQALAAAKVTAKKED